MKSTFISPHDDKSKGVSMVEKNNNSRVINSLNYLLHSDSTTFDLKEVAGASMNQDCFHFLQYSISLLYGLKSILFRKMSYCLLLTLTAQGFERFCLYQLNGLF